MFSAVANLPDVIITPAAFAITLHQILDNAVCGVVWLGYANVLFIGLETVSDSANDVLEEARRRVELSTHYCTWILRQRSQQICTADDTREGILETFGQLKSQPIVRWNVNLANWTLDLEFADDWSLQFIPWDAPEMSYEELNGDAWVLETEDRYYAVSCAGQITIQIKKRLGH